MIQGLRDLADWLENTEEALIDTYQTCYTVKWADDKEQVVALAQAGSIEKVYSNSYMDLKKLFGPVRYEMSIARKEVCERKVVGTRKVEKRDPDLVEQVPMIEVDEEIIEWECLPILRPTED
jgi:hypothetical protein